MKSKPAVNRRDPGLVLVEGQVHPFGNRLKGLRGPVGIPAADQNRIIGVAMQRRPQLRRIPSAMPHLVEQVQVNVTVQRRDGRPLRDPLPLLVAPALVQTPTFRLCLIRRSILPSAIRCVISFSSLRCGIS